MEQIKQLDLHCPKCSHVMIADIDLEALVKDRARKLLDRAADPRTMNSFNPADDKETFINSTTLNTQ